LPVSRRLAAVSLAAAALRIRSVAPTASFNSIQDASFDYAPWPACNWPPWWRRHRWAG